jgi:D-alanine-D-alanine ligase
MSRLAVLGRQDDAAPIAGILSVLGHDAAVIEPGNDLVGRLQALAPDVALLAHRDRSGRVQGLLELLRIPYTHSGVLATALAGNRHQAKIVLRAAGVPVTDHLVVGREEAAAAHQMVPPYVVKPLLAGSGPPPLAVAASGDPPAALYGPEWAGVDAVLVERYVAGRSLCVAVMGGVALGVSEALVESGEAPDPQTKIHLLTAAELSPNIYENLQKMALNAHEVLGCRGVTEVAFRLDGRASGATGLVSLGVNTQPGLGAVSPVLEQARFAGHSFADVVAWMVEDASCSR